MQARAIDCASSYVEYVMPGHATIWHEKMNQLLSILSQLSTNTTHPQGRGIVAAGDGRGVAGEVGENSEGERE